MSKKAALTGYQGDRLCKYNRELSVLSKKAARTGCQGDRLCKYNRELSVLSKKAALTGCQGDSYASLIGIALFFYKNLETGEIL